MADFNALQAIINAYIKRNGVQAITGQILNGVLTGMVNALGKGYTVAGAASPTTDPGTMTGPLAYIAYTAGTYTHFDNIVVEQGEVSMLIYNEAEWHKEVLFSLAAQATVDANVGTPAVGVSFVDGVLTFDFRNMKGNPGDDGDPAGFGTISASISGGVGTPGVSVQSSGPDTAKNIAFQFTNLKGETGVTSCVVTVDNTTGNPSCAVSLVGQELHLDFSGLKGAQGNTGSSVDYPYELVNNCTTDDATKGLAASQGVALQAEVSQLEAIVNRLAGRFYGVFDDESELPEGSTVGYAFVGTSEPLVLFTFDGTDWIDTTIQLYGIVGPQGPQGIQGIQGPQGPAGVSSVVASVDSNTGVPSVDVSLVDGLLTFTFHNIKGAQGNTGSSVSYPFTLVNNLTTNDATQALTAAMGKYLYDLIVGASVEEQIDLSGYSNIGYFLAQISPYAWQKTGDNSNNSNSIVIPLADIDNIKVTLTGKGDIAFLKSVNAEKNVVGDFSDTYPNTISLEDQTVTYNTIPADANYLYVKSAISDGTNILGRYAVSTLVPSSGAVFRNEIVDNLNSTSATKPLSANQGRVLKEKIEKLSENGAGNFRIHPITEIGESQNGTIVTTVYSSEYAIVDVEKYRGKSIFVHNLHSASGCSQIKDGSNTVLKTFDGEDTDVGVVLIPNTAKTFVISNSFVNNPDFYIEVPENLVRKNGLIFGENFLSDYDDGDFSQFKGTVTDGYGLALPGTGASNGLIVNRVIALDNWSLVADVLTANNTEVVNLGTKITQQGTSANHSTRVEVSFGGGTIKIYNNSNGNLAQSGDISSIVSGNIYTIKLERIDRAIQATLINRTTGASLSIVSPDGAEGSGNEGTNPAGKMFDSPIYYVGSGTPYLQNIYATCLRNAKVFIVGDSNTAGAHTTYETSWAQMAAEYFGNSLTGGRGSGDVLCCLNELRSILPVVKPKAVVVTIGTNYNSSMSKTGYIGLFKSIINIVREYGATPIINNVCACDARKTGLTIINEVVDELKQIGCRFDLATSLNNDWDDGQDTQYYYTDNVHLNVAGNALLYGIITTQLGWLKNI